MTERGDARATGPCVTPVWLPDAQPGCLPARVRLALLAFVALCACTRLRSWVCFAAGAAGVAGVAVGILALVRSSSTKGHP